MSPWSKFSSCSLLCNSSQIRTRDIITQPTNDGIAWNSTSEIQSCNAQPCTIYPTITTATTTTSVDCCSSPRAFPATGACITAVCDCVLNQWTAWYPPCPVPCVSINITRIRKILYGSTNGGAPCSGIMQETSSCNCTISTTRTTTTTTMNESISTTSSSSTTTTITITATTTSTTATKTIASTSSPAIPSKPAITSTSTPTIILHHHQL